MAVRLRLSRGGRIHRPFYRVNAVDRRRPRDTKVIEQLGTYDPICPDPEKQVVLNKERIEYWLGVGAQPSDTLRALLVKQGINVSGGK